MNDDIPWAYVAMIFIAFVSWVYGRLREAAEIRRARAEAKRAAQEARNRAQPTPPPSPYRPPVTTTPPPSRAPSHPEPAATPPSEIEVPKTFRELFEMLQEQAPPPPVAKRQAPPTAPPPLPSTSGEPVQSEVDRIFYGTGKTVKTAPPMKVERVRGKTSSNLNRILKNRGTLREALILKEILDTPVAMKE